MAIRQQHRSRSHSTKPCAMAAFAAGSTCCWKASAAASPGAQCSSSGEYAAAEHFAGTRSGLSPVLANAHARQFAIMSLALVFPGQGSQAVGMMQGFAESKVVRDTFTEASDVLGQDLWQLAEAGPAPELNATVNTQPLMLTAGYAVYRAWAHAGGAQPARVAGHSLGEYTALVVAGVISFSEALPLVRFRAQAMQDAVPLGTGAMAAILGLDDEAVRAACNEAAQGEVVEPVNFNAPGQ